ncbi:MAG: hypothetical protein WKF87_21315 [Chryseolinea sp.]
MKILKELGTKLMGIMNGSTFATWKSPTGIQTTTIYTCSKERLKDQERSVKMTPAFLTVRVNK